VIDPKVAEAKKLLDELDFNSICPIVALLKLHELKKKME
jgi:DNA mismatch repair protein MutS